MLSVFLSYQCVEIVGGSITTLSALRLLWLGNISLTAICTSVSFPPVCIYYQTAILLFQIIISVISNTQSD